MSTPFTLGRCGSLNGSSCVDHTVSVVLGTEDPRTRDREGGGVPTGDVLHLFKIDLLGKLQSGSLKHGLCVRREDGTCGTSIS